MELNQQEYELNRTGTLTAAQIKKLRTAGYMYVVLAVIMFACTPIAYVPYEEGKIGPMLTVLILFLLMGTLFAWMSKEEFRLSRLSSPCVNSIGGNLTIRIRGKHAQLEIGGQSFRMQTYLTRKLKNGARYEFFYIDQSKRLVGWKLMQ